MMRVLDEMRAAKQCAEDAARSAGEAPETVGSPAVCYFMERFGMSREQAEMWEDTT